MLPEISLVKRALSLSAKTFADSNIESPSIITGLNNVTAEGFSYMEQQKQLYANAYAPWTEEDDNRLQTLYENGMKIKELMEVFCRNYGAINSRLKKLGLK